jgi:hypothetical protein
LHNVRLQLGDQLQHIFSAHAPPDHNLPRAIKARQAAKVLAQVDPNNRDLHCLSPFLLSR